MLLLPPSSSGLGHLVLSQETGVRFPVGVLVLVIACQGRLAQLVEHYVHIVGVTGSSPVATILSSIVAGYEKSFPKKMTAMRIAATAAGAI